MKDENGSLLVPVSRQVSGSITNVQSTSRRYQYQSPLGSTTGGTTALANYPWLDYSVGTDSEFFVNNASELAKYMLQWQHSSILLLVTVPMLSGRLWLCIFREDSSFMPVNLI